MTEEQEKKSRKIALITSLGVHGVIVKDKSLGCRSDRSNQLQTLKAFGEMAER